MIRLTYKQIEDLYFLSGMLGGAPLAVETVPMNGLSGYLTYAYTKDGERGWQIPKQGQLRELKNP